MSQESHRFLCDEHVSLPFCRALTRLGLDVIHVIDAGLRRTPDPDLLRWARDEGRILITRNHRDFVPLVQAWATDGVGFPGVLLISRSIPEADVGAHVRALTAWLEGPGDVANTHGWLA